MFFLISLVFAKNYCIEKTSGDCFRKCSKYQILFDDIFSRIPFDSESNNDEIHNIYIADNFKYKKTKNNLIFCDPSNYLIYTNYSSSIKIKNVIETDYENISTNIPILFQTFGNVNLEVDTKGSNSYSPIILEAKNKNTKMSIKINSENIPQNLLSISKNSKQFQISNLTNDLRKVFNATEKILDINEKYYCISDKQEKCKSYSAFELTYINSTRDISSSNCVVIIDTKTPQFYDQSYSYSNINIDCLLGSDVTVHMRSQVLTLNSDSIEIGRLFIEGSGSITIVTPSNLLINCTTTTTNNLNLSLKSQHPLSYDYSEIHAYRSDMSVNLLNKIKVPEFCVFHGDRSLSGLFEEGKFICDDEIVTQNVNSDNLKEYPFNSMDYYFTEGNHDIRKTWKKRSYFYGTPNTTFTFNDVHSYLYDCIDNFINLSNYKSVTIKPSKFLKFKSFSDKPRPNFTIHVDHDFIMEGNKYNDLYADKDEVKDRWCRITGNGTIKFISDGFMEDVKFFCDYDEDAIKFLYLGQSNAPSYYVCVGQSDLKSCKSKIKGGDSYQEDDFIWVRNIRTIDQIDNHKTTYITDYQYAASNYNGVVLTANANLVVDSSYITIERNKIKNYLAQDKKAKLTVLVWDKYIQNPNKLGFHMDYNADPTEIDFRVYFYYEHIKLYTYYREIFNNSAIPIEGRCCVYIREPFEPMISFFKYPSSIEFVINYGNDFNQICYANEAKECTYLNDFVLAKNYDEFIKFEEVSSTTVYLFKSIFLRNDLNSYRSTQFYCERESITIEIKVPNDALINFEKYSTYVITAKKYCFDSYYLYGINYVFDLKKAVTLDCSSWHDYHSYYIYNFTSSEESVYIMANPEVKNLGHISVSGDFNITSPVPQYLRPLFDDKVVINQSSNWTYLYYSEEGLELNGSYPFVSFKNYRINDGDLSRNIVLAVGPDDNITFPHRWTKEHDVIILQKKRNFLINEPTNLTFCYDGIKLNDRIKIVCGKISIILPNQFNINAYFPYYYYYYKNMNDVELICSGKVDTYLYTGTYNIHWSSSKKQALISGYNKDNMLIIKYDSSKALSHLNNLLSYSQTGYEYSFLYDYICHSPKESICAAHPNYIITNDTSSFLKAVRMCKEAPAIIYQDLNIPYPTGHYYRLNLSNENIKVSLPSSPNIMNIYDNNLIKFEYPDLTLYEFINQGTIDVELDEYPLYLDIKSDTNSSITFKLKSDIHLHAISDYNASFKISVIKNKHHLYTDDFEQFEPIFGDSIEYFSQYCAHDSTNYSIERCTYQLNDTIENVFSEPFIAKQIEIAPLTIPVNIDLFQISFSIEVNVMNDSLEILNLSNVSSIQINKDQSVMNEYWKFNGNFNKLIIKLNPFSSFSIRDEVEQPMSFELTSNESVIDLKDCVQQNKSFITFIKEGTENNEVTLYGSLEIYDNFIKSINSHEGITFIRNGSKKYLCICRSEESCNKCKEGIDGRIVETGDIVSDPGEDVEIRIFSNFEISSSIFTNIHDVLIDPTYKLNLTYVEAINQNITEGLIADNLIFKNVTNLLIKPKGPSLDITVKKHNAGPHFSIELDAFLKFNVVNSKEEGINESRIYVSGSGELNLNDYPSHRIRPNSTSIKVIKGVYIICGTIAGNNVCSYNTEKDYKALGISDSFRNDFDNESKIIVFLDSFTRDVVAPINFLRGQKVQIIHTNSRLLEERNRLRVVASERLTIGESESELSGTVGEALFDSSDFDSIVIDVNDTFYIKQEGNISTNESSPELRLEATSESVTINISDTVDIEKQKLKIESSQNKTISVRLVLNVTEENKEAVNKFVTVDKDNVKLSIGEEYESSSEEETMSQTESPSDEIPTEFPITESEYPSSEEETVSPTESSSLEPSVSETAAEVGNPIKARSKGLSVGVIVAIVVAAVVVAAAVILSVIFVVRKKNFMVNSIMNKIDDESDSIGI
ncbi:hypothetical protein M9Y10_025868 [Tritrichomonas musculus]|uniref:Uncharacterized protein n=1 Tax=Tritrichomonas musculus TaxID=1915356 RepID=A0ABR2H7Y7_9EUKA